MHRVGSIVASAPHFDTVSQPQGGHYLLFPFAAVQEYRITHDQRTSVAYADGNLPHTGEFGWKLRRQSRGVPNAIASRTSPLVPRLRLLGYRRRSHGGQ